MTKKESLKAFEKFVKRYDQLCKKNSPAEKIRKAWEFVQQFKIHSEKAGASAAEIAAVFNRGARLA